MKSKTPEIAAPADPRTLAVDKIGLLFLGGHFLLFCALTLAAAAAWRAYRQHVESSEWPAVAAQVSGCRVHTWYDSWHGRARSLHHVECSFRYEVGAVPYVVKAKVGDELSLVRGQIDVTRPAVTVSTLRWWVKQHPDGTTETIHYDPAHSDRISLLGVDRDLKWQTTAGYLYGVGTFAMLAAGLELLAVCLRRHQGP